MPSTSDLFSYVYILRYVIGQKKERAFWVLNARRQGKNTFCSISRLQFQFVHSIQVVLYRLTNANPHQFSKNFQRHQLYEYQCIVLTNWSKMKRSILYISDYFSVKVYKRPIYSLMNSARIGKILVLFFFFNSTNISPKVHYVQKCSVSPEK